MLLCAETLHRMPQSVSGWVGRLPLATDAATLRQVHDSLSWALVTARSSPVTRRTWPPARGATKPASTRSPSGRSCGAAPQRWRPLSRGAGRGAAKEAASARQWDSPQSRSQPRRTLRPPSTRPRRANRSVHMPSPETAFVCARNLMPFANMRLVAGRHALRQSQSLTACACPLSPDGCLAKSWVGAAQLGRQPTHPWRPARSAWLANHKAPRQGLLLAKPVMSQISVKGACAC